MRILDLQEERDTAFNRADLSEAEALAISANAHFELDWPSPINSNRYRIRSKGWIGHVPIGDLMLVIRPKVSISTLFGMLEVAYNLRGFEILQGATHIESLEEIYGRIASILAKRVLDRSRRGLYRGYIQHSEDLQNIRGRINVRKSIRNAFVGSARLHCEYEELTADLEENQILEWALYVASRLGIKSSEAKVNVQRAFRCIAGSVSLNPISALKCVGRTYHRLNQDYQPMHGLSRFLIEHAGPGLAKGGHEFLPFTVNMPGLFEAFAAAWLKTHLPPELRAEAQVNAKLEGDSDLTFRIDLVIRDAVSGLPAAVLDTKYKLDEKPKESDLQQIVAYAVQMGVKQGFLIYPSALERPIETKVGDVRVRSVALDISGDLAHCGDELLMMVLGSLRPQAA